MQGRIKDLLPVRKRAESESKKSNDFGIALQTMLNSGDPMQWLVDNADVLTQDEIKELYKYAQNAGIQTDKLFAQATKENRIAYQELKDIYINGINPYGGYSQYKDNPEAALKNLRSEPMHQQLLGPLYKVLEAELEQAVQEAELEQAVQEKKEKDKDTDSLWKN